MSGEMALLLWILGSFAAGIAIGIIGAPKNSDTQRQEQDSG